MLLLNFANACFNAGATCALHRNLSSNLHKRGKSQDCFPAKTGFSASSKWSKLWNLRGHWRTVPGVLTSTTLLHAEIIFIGLFFSLWIQLWYTCDLNWHQLSTKGCADSPGFFQQQGLACANFYCQLGADRSHKFLSSQFPLAQGGQSRQPQQGDSSAKACLQLQLLQLWFLSELINRSLCSVETFNFTEILSGHLQTWQWNQFSSSQIVLTIAKTCPVCSKMHLYSQL